MEIDETTVLCRAQNMRVNIDPSPNMEIWVEDTPVMCGPRGLAVLDAFSQPTSLADAMKALRGRSAGMEDWVDLIHTIQWLHEAGVLVAEGEMTPTLVSHVDDYSGAPIHIDMLEDRERTSSFVAAIKDTVRPNDVVVDLGTGTGVLAIAAVQAGAKHVYAIEAAGIAGAAQRLFEANGVAERITLVRGWSTQVSLPERGDVLVSEMIGADPMEERVLEATWDARKRLLKRGARLIPGRVRVSCTPVTIPERVIRRYTFTEPSTRKWKRWYGIDFEPLTQIAKASNRSFQVWGRVPGKWEALSSPLLLAEVDLKRAKSLSLNRTATAEAESPGTLNGLLMHSEVELVPGIVLSTDPARPGRPGHWVNPVWIVDELTLGRHDRFRVRYRYAGGNTEMSCKALRRR
jgi:hypothetical protein